MEEDRTQDRPPPLGPESEERNWAFAAHIAGPAGYLLSAGALGWIAPLVIWLAKREDSEFAAGQAKEALDFQITVFLASVVSVVAGFVLGIVTCGVGWILAGLVLGGIWVGNMVLSVVAAIAVMNGERYRYPFNLRLLP